MKDYIYVYDGNNNKIKMEVVTIFNIDKYDFNYIIYSEVVLYTNFQPNNPFLNAFALISSGCNIKNSSVQLFLILELYHNRQKIQVKILCKL